MSIKNFTEYQGIKNLSMYKDKGLEVLLLYSRIGRPISNDLVGAHFIMGKLLSVAGDNITFDGPKSHTPSGVEYDGSPFDITQYNTIMVIPVRDIKHPTSGKLHHYQFTTMYDVKMLELGVGVNPLDGFMCLVSTVQSLISDRKMGYTMPVKLESIDNILKDEPMSINVDKSEFSNIIHVAGTGTGKAKYV